jgi:DNA-binding CsgD family transcriptional regulator
LRRRSPPASSTTRASSSTGSSRAQRLDRAWSRGCAARGRALLAEALGDHEAADAAFARAYEQHERRPQQWPRYERARTLLAHGTILRRRRRKAESRDHLRRAQALFDELGAGLWSERTRSELARISGRRSADGLTETERRVAALAAQGLSTKEVAASLSVAPKTVDGHLSRIYPKLGVRSRTQLARRLAPQERE